MATTPTALLRKIESLEEKVLSLTEIVIAQGDDVLDAKEAAKLLGYTTPRTLHNLVNRSEGPPFPAYKGENNRLWFKRSELVEYLTRNRIAPSHELAQSRR